MMEFKAQAQQPCDPQPLEPQQQIDPLDMVRAVLGADMVAAMLASANETDVSDIRVYK